ncbi:MFS transporter [Micromonospora sp. PLK6-60]|uniref:MFS transporter n=1 Tax=Micromonospora sp. PLK6-60 TaxID=2873383 RepID=UPI001CA75387|nr:MFS transporter [Micromonospora sp. PLK6-60]MBY8873515.1 MFS transporter [Micromonospora sp. PLK6-60]
MTASLLGRDYRLLWWAAVASRFGDALRTPALALLAATLTRDPRAIAVVTVAGQLPPLLFGLLGGAYADRWDRRRTMAAVDAARAAVVAALAVLVAGGRAGVATVAAVAALLATLGALFDAASFAVLPALVPPGALPVANGRLQAGTAVAGGFLGAPLAGLLFAVSAAVPFGLNALTFVLAALLVLAIVPAPPATGRSREPVWRSAWAGVRWLRRDRVLWALALVTAGSNVAISGITAVLVLYALEVLRVPPAAYGLFAAGAVVGGLLGALGAGRLAARFGTLGALRGVLLGQSVALAGFAAARHPVAGAVALGCFAAGGAVWNSLWSAYGQRHVPARLLGRVGAAQRVVGLAAAPVGAAAAGLAAGAYGLVPVGWAAAFVFALVSAVGWRALHGQGSGDGSPPRP